MAKDDEQSHTNKILAGIIVTLVGIGATYMFSHNQGKVAGLAAAHAEHEALEGHPVIVERVKTLSSKLDAVGLDVKESQRTLSKIDATLERWEYGPTP